MCVGVSAERSIGGKSRIIKEDILTVGVAHAGGRW